MEFALVVPLFILLLVGLFDIGRAVYAYNTVNNAAREGGRLAVVDQTTTDIQARAAGAAVGLGIPPSSVGVDFRLPTSPSEVPGTCNSEIGDDGIYGCIAVVRVPYQFFAATPIISNILGSISILGEVRFPVEFNCLDSGSVDCPIAET